MSRLLLQELRTCRTLQANTTVGGAEAAEAAAKAAEAEGDATSERGPGSGRGSRMSAADTETSAVDKRAKGVYVREACVPHFKRAASAGGTSPAPLRPRHHRGTSPDTHRPASQECEPGVVREQDTRCQECQSEGWQDILELSEGEQSGSGLSIGTDRSAADERGGAEQLALQPKAKPYVRKGSAQAVKASGIEWRPPRTWSPGVAWWHGTSLDGRHELEMFRAAQARVGSNRSVGPPSLYDIWSAQKWQNKGGV